MAEQHADHRFSLEEWGPPPSPIAAGLGGKCPRCGRGHLFSGFLTTAPSCDVCGLDFAFIDSGDGPAVFVILIAGFIVVGLALWLEIAVQPPLWVHLLIWAPVVLIATLGMIRPLKGIMIAQQFASKAAEHRAGE